jgi:DeoR/GlpR family transcriptional regulator of sugar metabolism
VRIPRHLVEARRRRLAQLLQKNGYLPVSEICRSLEISEATVRRDLAALAGQQKITRTYGGALVEKGGRFPSFEQRQLNAADAKRRIAIQARRLIQPRFTCYLDVGTTVFAIAELLREQPIKPLRVVTSNLPVAEALADNDGVNIHLLGGELLPRQSALFGEMARRVLPMWKFDLAFMSAEGVTAEGIWNTDREVTMHQRAVMRRAKQNIFCVDETKIGSSARELLMKLDTTIYLLTDAPRRKLERSRIRIRPEQYIAA